MNVKPNPESVECLPPDEDELPWPEPRARIADDTDWRRKLVTSMNKNGDVYVECCGANVETILRYHPAWRGVIAYDQFADFVIKAKAPPWPAKAVSPSLGEWTDDDTTDTIHWLEREEHMLGVGLGAIEGAINVTAKASAFHPVRDYLSNLKWDGEPRIAKLLPTYFGAADNDYTRGVGKRWMISAVARAFEPGCQVDCAIILEGPQGIGKSTGLRSLVPSGKWYSDTGINMGEKDGFQSLRSVWIVGLDELDSLKRSEVTKTKTFISSRVDRYRPSFGRRAKDFPRQCVFVGSTNECEYFVDSTGNRRFWPVRVEHTIPTFAIVRDRDQLWAEAVVCYRAGQPWHIDTEELRVACEAQQAERVQGDPWEEVIGRWLDHPHTAETLRPFAIGEEGVLTYDILKHALGKKPEHVTKFDQMRVAQVLRTLGYDRGPMRREGGARVRRFLKSPLSPVTT